MKMAGLISRDIVNFFEKTENLLLKNDKFDLSLSFMIDMTIKKQQSEKEESNNIKRLIKKFFQKN